MAYQVERNGKGAYWGLPEGPARMACSVGLVGSGGWRRSGMSGPLSRPLVSHVMLVFVMHSSKGRGLLTHMVQASAPAHKMRNALPLLSV